MLVRLAALVDRINPHGRRAFTLVGGASAAQFIPLAIAPVLTRLYSPRDYGTLAVFASIAAVFTAVAAGRYTVAIMLPRDHHDAVQVTGLSVLLAASTSGLLLLLVPFALWLLSDVSVVQDLGAWLYLVPLAVFLGSLAESLGYFSLRVDKVGQMARARVLKTAVGGGAQVSLGLLGVGVAGLVGGALLGHAAGNSRLVRTYADHVRAHPLRWVAMKALAAKYSKFPKYDLWASLANSLSYNGIVLGVGIVYASQAVGHYALAYRVTMLPAVLLGVALGQVYLREAALRVSAPTLALRAFYRTAALLALLSLAPFAVIGIWGQTLFDRIFGPEWAAAGTYAAAMMPLVWARFVASPLTSVFHIYGRQRALLGFQVVLLALVTGSMLVAFSLDWTLFRLLLVQSSILGAFYIVILYAARRTIMSSGTTINAAEPPPE